jgi:hypothetical protein
MGTKKASIKRVGLINTANHAEKQRDALRAALELAVFNLEQWVAHHGESTPTSEAIAVAQAAIALSKTHYLDVGEP